MENRQYPFGIPFSLDFYLNLNLCHKTPTPSAEPVHKGWGEREYTTLWNSNSSVSVFTSTKHFGNTSTGFLNWTIAGVEWNELGSIPEDYIVANANTPQPQSPPSSNATEVPPANATGRWLMWTVVYFSVCVILVATALIQLELLTKLQSSDSVLKLSSKSFKDVSIYALPLNAQKRDDRRVGCWSIVQPAGVGIPCNSNNAGGILSFC